MSVDCGMQILCTTTEDANGEANEGDGWLAGFYQGQVYFPALGRIYRGAVVALEADASRREGTHFCVVSLLQRKMDPPYASSVGG